MAVPLIGNAGVIFSTTDPKNGRRSRTRWWADRGLLHWEDQDTGAYGSVKVRDGLERLQAINAMIKNSRADRSIPVDDIVNFQRYVDDMIVECRKAQQQGMPDNVAHARQHAQDWKAKRHSRLVTVPGLARF